MFRLPDAQKLGQHRAAAVITVEERPFRAASGVNK
jgi:hypothetical protein